MSDDEVNKAFVEYASISMDFICKKKSIGKSILNVRFRLRSQLVDATHALNLLAGVSNSNVLRGRSFN